MNKQSEGELNSLPSDKASEDGVDVLSEIQPELIMPLVKVDFVPAPSPEEHRIWAARRLESESRHFQGISQRHGGRVI